MRVSLGRGRVFRFRLCDGGEEKGARSGERKVPGAGDFAAATERNGAFDCRIVLIGLTFKKKQDSNRDGLGSCFLEIIQVLQAVMV